MQSPAQFESPTGAPIGRGRISAPTVVLSLLCVMYLILFVDRVNIGTAAPLIKLELNLSNTQMGLVFSAFAVSYAVFQLLGSWIGDKSCTTARQPLTRRRRSIAWSGCAILLTCGRCRPKNIARYSRQRDC